jgi:cytochrome c biogenesis protein
MSVAEETIEKAAQTQIVERKNKSLLERGLDGLSSVRFGVFLLILLVVLAMIGMLIVQQNVQGFDNFYASATPAEKFVYGWLGFYDIYHTWYFNLLLLILSLNIVLASIDRFPTAWVFVAKPKTEASKAYLLNQKFNAQIENGAPEQIAKTFQKFGFKTKITTQSNGRICIFGQKNPYNRLGAYIVHVALLLLFLGHFVALQTGFDADVRMTPGETQNQISLIRYNLDKQERAAVSLPFSLTCTDIEQKLIKHDGSIEVSNTLDWFTRMRIDDPIYGSREVSVSLNQPYTYRGYRFFQASAITLGSARKMTLRLTPAAGGEPFTVELRRNGAVTLPDKTKIEYLGFFPDFTLNGTQPDTRSGDYNNPAVWLKITAPDGEQKNAYAFAADLPAGAPVGAGVLGYKFHLADYEKSPSAHVLSIKYDPFYGSTIAWYFGGGLLILSLCFVFFTAHQRLWAVVEQNGKTTLGGHANRNEIGFADKFAKITAALNGNFSDTNK